MSKTKTFIPGNVDFDIIKECNMHCKGCHVLDFLSYENGEGRVTITTKSFAEIKELFIKLSEDYLFECITIVGGEPTIHPEFYQIVRFLDHLHCIKHLRMVTNGTNFTPEVIRAMAYIDYVYISDYLLATDRSEGVIGHEMVARKWPFKYDIWVRKTFHEYAVAMEGRDGQEQWDKCWMKDGCKVMTLEGLHLCRIGSNENFGMAPWTNPEEVEALLYRDEPFDRCATCTIEDAKEIPWETHKSEVDAKNYLRGLNLIKAVEI